MSFYHPDPVSAERISDWYFAPLLPWQQARWDYLTQHYPDLPHAMLFAGSAGTGKRQFVYRLVAWMLCQQKSPNGACGHCKSCQWLKSGTHPNIFQIPLPISLNEDGEGKSKTKASIKKAPSLTDNSPHHATTHSIKIDDIREIQPFVQHSSEGVRIVVIHQAESMTLGASNALLKTLEEPAQNVFLILISDTPSKLLPTIRSRLQQFEVSQINEAMALDFLHSNVAQENFVENAVTADNASLRQVLAISGNAPFVAMDMLTSPWYQQRQLWVNSWQAIRSGSRTPTQASDFWQGSLTLNDFLYLSQVMLAELGNHLAGLPISQSDISWQKLTPVPMLLTVHTLQQVIEQVWQDRRQHIGEKLCYDKLMYAFSQH